jgi:hypothetical protein
LNPPLDATTNGNLANQFGRFWRAVTCLQRRAPDSFFEKTPLDYHARGSALASVGIERAKSRLQ